MNYEFLVSLRPNKHTKMKFIGIIPARYASTRFPGKPLALLGGKTVIQRVYEQVVSVLGEAYVATDDERIYNAVEQFGGRAIMTRNDHKSGTDRIQEAVEKIQTDADVIINVQGDEPFIQKSQLETVKHLFDDPQTQIATLGKPFENMEAVENPNSPKIICDLNGYAMYFSRSVIPYIRGKEQKEWIQHFPFLKHIGLYAYRREVLSEVTKLPQSPLEIAESLEQLRWLQNGYRIKVGLTDVETIGIDTPDDLARAEAFLKE
jgi:3-deoxy-manno-octulosonate cytidylyltransferase (CMP-KDO synthetase)